MERLTDKNADGNYFYPKCFEKCDGLGASSKCDNCEITTSICEKLGEYEDLEEQGRLIKLPCDFGATLFWISTEDDNGNKCLTINSYGEDEPIEAIAVDREGKLYVATQDYALDYFDELGGKYALLSKKDAEAKLKELRGGENEV